MVPGGGRGLGVPGGGSAPQMPGQGGQQLGSRAEARIRSLERLLPLMGGAAREQALNDVYSEIEAEEVGLKQDELTNHAAAAIRGMGSFQQETGADLTEVTDSINALLEPVLAAKTARELGVAGKNYLEGVQALKAKVLQDAAKKTHRQAALNYARTRMGNIPALSAKLAYIENSALMEDVDGDHIYDLVNEAETGLKPKPPTAKELAEAGGKLSQMPSTVRGYIAHTARELALKRLKDLVGPDDNADKRRDTLDDLFREASAEILSTLPWENDFPQQQREPPPVPPPEREGTKVGLQAVRQAIQDVAGHSMSASKRTYKAIAGVSPTGQALRAVDAIRQKASGSKDPMAEKAKTYADLLEQTKAHGLDQAAFLKNLDSANISPEDIAEMKKRGLL